MKKMKEIFLKITKPTPLTVGLSVTFLVIIAVITPILLTAEMSGGLEIIAYASYGLSAIGLAYAVCVFVMSGPRIRRMVVEHLHKNPLTNKLISNYGFRALIASTVAFGMSLINSVINAYLGISERSIWFGALAAYYILLALMRSGMLTYQIKPGNFESGARIRAKIYTRCGLLLLILNAALSSAIAQMIFDDRGFEYKDWLIYAFAAYAFYKVIMSVINAVRAGRQEDLAIRAVREINTVDAAVSILALQTALLHTFTDGSVDISLFNTLTGSAVSLFSLSLSISMIIRGRKKIKEIKNGK